MQLNRIHKVPTEEFKKYTENRTAFSKTYNPKLVNFTLPTHFLEKLNKLDISIPDGVFQLFNDYPEITNTKDRINIKIENKQASFKFLPEQDAYNISIPQTNHNQYIAMLIHELSHVVCQEKTNHQISTLYESEKGALEIELKITKKLSGHFQLANIQEYITCLIRTEFEQLIFQNPNQNIGQVYLQCVEKYLGKPNNNLEFEYLKDNKIIMKPLTDLSTAVALVSLTT